MDSAKAFREGRKAFLAGQLNPDEFFPGEFIVDWIDGWYYEENVQHVRDRYQAESTD
jgi:hypothetical protein